MNDEKLKEALEVLEGLGVIFCEEGGAVWKAAGIREHLTAVEFHNRANWVALGPLDPSLSTDERELVRHVLEWCASTGYETRR